MNASFELAGFVVGIIGAIWLKISMNFLKQERDQPETKKLLPGEESPAVTDTLSPRFVLGGGALNHPASAGSPRSPGGSGRCRGSPG